MIESNNIKSEMEQVKQKVERSEKLLTNLTSEKERWSEQMTEFKSQINNLLGDTFLSSSFSSSLSLSSYSLSLLLSSSLLLYFSLFIKYVSQKSFLYYSIQFFSFVHKYHLYLYS